MAQANHIALRGSIPGMRHSFDEATSDTELDPGEDHAYTCPDGHLTELLFSIESTEIPATWACRRCGKKAKHSYIEEGEPSKADVDANRHKPIRPGSWVTAYHAEQVTNRRSPQELEELLAWARTRVPWANS